MIEDWWTSREPRERLLVAMAGLLSAVVILWFGILAPARAAHIQARADYARSLDDRAAIEQALVRLQPGGGGSAPAADGDRFRAEVARAAQERGLVITRLQGDSDGTVQFVFEQTTAVELFGWLSAIADLPGATPVGATLNRRDDRLQAIVQLQGTRS